MLHPSSHLAGSQSWLRLMALRPATNVTQSGHSRRLRLGPAAATCLRSFEVMVLLAVAANWVVSPTNASDSWPRWRGPLGNGTWVAPPRLKEQWPEKLERRWKLAIGPGYSGVAVANGRVYTLDRIEESKQERIICVDLDSGQLIWEYAYRADYKDLDYGKGPRSTPSIVEGRVYVLGAVGHLTCLGADRGELIWKHDLQTSHKARIPMWGFASSPVVYDGKLIVHAGIPNGCYTAFDPKSGKELWRAGSDPAGYGTPVLIRQGSQQILVGWTPEHIVGLSMSGKLLWNVPYKVTYGVTMATPLVVGDRVIVSGYWEGTKALRLSTDLQHAELDWEENRNLRGVMAQALKRGEVGYLLDKRHGLVAFSSKDGKRLWSDKNQLTKRDRNPQATLVQLGESDKGIALNAEGQVVYFRLTSMGYQEIARSGCVQPTWAHPAYVGGLIVARDDNELVCCQLPIK